ncbi:MAG: DUF2284 domain-containing protein [Candidatus Amulumruptor caecigallinarius]|nr:DUF2284 domain-containing protein [Candidatus Amulumruptor caecigallinarius]
MENRSEYSIEYFSTDISVEEYIANFRDEARFIEMCRQCPNHGNSWGCPPFNFDTESYMRQYRHVHLMATKITPRHPDMFAGSIQEFIRPERIRIEKRLLEMEKKYGGRAFAYIGSCLHCKGAECMRKFKKPCLHPDKVRPSLEAFGFDISRTLTELFDIQLIWGKNGGLPEYLVLVCALFHNSDSLGSIPPKTPLLL